MKDAYDYVNDILQLSVWKPEHGDDTYEPTVDDYKNAIQQAMAQAWDEGRKEAQNVCGTLSEGELSDGDEFTAALKCESYIRILPNPYKDK